MTNTPLRLRWLWFKQWPLWLLTGNSISFHNARVTYVRELGAWLKREIRMNLYVWHRASGATKNYHDEGGVLVIAETIDRAREMIKSKADAETCEALTALPDPSQGVW